MFERSTQGMLPFWTYRRLRDGSLIDSSGVVRDVAMINWPANDYHWASLIDTSTTERARIIDEAKRLALGFLYWLQTEAPHDNDQECGYPGLRLMPEIMGTPDGLSKAPYIRESRRIIALRRIVEDEIAANGRTGARAAHVTDSVGVGWYHIDLHNCVGNPTSMYAPALPFQIPLGALIPKRLTNLIAACKNIGTTHITNGAYRLHPVEWNIGEAAGALAAFCCTEHCFPRSVYDHVDLLRRFQRQLLQRGVPLTWAIDVTADDSLFTPAQLLVLVGAIPPNSPRFHTLALNPDEDLTGADMLALVQAVQQLAFLETPLDLPHLNAQPPDRAARVDVAHVLSAIGVHDAILSEPPTWREVCAALARLVDHGHTAQPSTIIETESM
jgi:hypothetical protein